MVSGWTVNALVLIKQWNLRGKMTQSNTPPEISSWIELHFHDIISDIKAFSEIPAPSFDESCRTAELKKRVTLLGFTNFALDSVGNLIIRFPAKHENNKPTPHYVFSAHIDTVFDIDTDIAVREESGRLFGPGVCDNTTGLVSLLWLMRFINDHSIPPQARFTFLFNTCEEGLGNLKGIKNFIDNEPPESITAHICLEGHKLGRMTRNCIGNKRWFISIKTKGGHSWRDYGSPNAINLAAKLITELSQLKLSERPKATLNIGTIKGGTSVNSIADSCRFSVETRSKDPAALKVSADAITALIDRNSKADHETRVDLELVGDRPCGSMDNNELTRIILKVHSLLDINTDDNSGSTDSNYPISKGIPSVTIGITHARDTHSLKENLEIGPIRKGLTQLISLFLELNFHNQDY